MTRTPGGRLAAGGQIDRATPLGFSFDGQAMTGLTGDTLASALLANGVRLVGRSFKHHRPRGVFTAGPEEPNALMEIGEGPRRTPNTLATTAELFDGMAARSQNRWPSLAFDVLSVTNLLSPLMPAGFYYKTFMWPEGWWEAVYEPLIRRAAGLGRAAGAPDPDRYETMHAFCDVLIVGSGPAGLAAALAAGRTGARVILAEQDFLLGGRLNTDRLEIDGAPAEIWARAAEAELAVLPRVRVLRRTAVIGAYEGGLYAALERVGDHTPAPPDGSPRQRLWRIVAKASIVAAGAVERPIVFGANDLPGVMTASAVRTYVNRFAVSPGDRTVVFTTTDDGWSTAGDLTAAGLRVEAVIDPRDQVDTRLLDIARRAGARVLLGSAVADARGGDSLTAVDVVDTKTGGRERVAADLLAVSGGWDPQNGLAAHFGLRPTWSPSANAFIAQQTPPGMMVIGASAGRLTLSACLADGARAGAAAAEGAGFASPTGSAPRAVDEPAGATALWRVETARRKAYVDLQNDVTDKDVALAVREGFDRAELLKRYTTLGMGADQGRTSNVVGLALLAELTGGQMGERGVVLSRPPQAPVAIGALAGSHAGPHYRPVRKIAAHGWAEALGARFVTVGQWLRPQWFSRPQDADWADTVRREVLTVRSAVGVCDVSTLGKIDVQGPDAAAFLERLYVNTISNLPIGRVRYGRMLREDGFAFDDGTLGRLAEDHFIVSTTTVHAGAVMQHMEYCHQVLWPELDVQMASVTEQWSQYAIAGPKSRALLQRLLGETVDLSDPALPYMGLLQTRLGGVPARLFRISFCGELGFELAIPADHGAAMAHRLMACGEDLGVAPYGTEALGVMRIEKGHVAGPELNGRTTAHDLGLGRMMSKRKDYIGRVMAARPALTVPDRPALVGLRSPEPFSAGAHVLRTGALATADNDEGYVTSAAYSPMTQSWIGLAFVTGGAGRIGERLVAHDPVRGRSTPVEAVHPVFVDPEGARLHG